VKSLPSEVARRQRRARKVRTPQGSAPVNGRSGRPEGLVAQKTHS
jgi:hypothetical protein